MRIVAEESFDSFILQIRGKRDEAGNVTYPGEWMALPGIAKKIGCGKYRNVAIVDKGIIEISCSELSFFFNSKS